MNERIKHLLSEAKIYDGYDSITQAITTCPRDLEKFADLIVKESITMCDELKAQYLASRKSTMDFDEKNIYAEGEAACDIIKHKMKKQFGVEK